MSNTIKLAMLGLETIGFAMRLTPGDGARKMRLSPAYIVHQAVPGEKRIATPNGSRNTQAPFEFCRSCCPSWRCQVVLELGGSLEIWKLKLRHPLVLVNLFNELFTVTRELEN